MAIRIEPCCRSTIAAMLSVHRRGFGARFFEPIHDFEQLHRGVPLTFDRFAGVAQLGGGDLSLAGSMPGLVTAPHRPA